MAYTPVALADKPVEIPSRRYGTYRVRSRIGQGGMAEVFLAEAVDKCGDQVFVALKLMKKGMSEEAFADEADLMGLLQHDNLVNRLEIGEAYGRPFIAMEYLIGGDLRGVMEAHRRESLGLSTAMGIHVTLEVLKACAYFHQAKTRTGTALNLVHSDVNPSNVFFSAEGDVKLGDFGVVKSDYVGVGVGEGVTAGKLSYLSPEQTRGERIGPPSDLWAVGVMLHEMVVGFHPFQREGATQEQTVAMIRSPKLSYPDFVDRPLAAIVSKALSPDLRTRYRTAGEFGGALFQYALESNLTQTHRDVQAWLEQMMGLVV